MREKEQLLLNSLLKFSSRFPNWFDNGRLQQGFRQLIGNVEEEFILNRSTAHLCRILMAQFFLQKKIDAALHIDPMNNHCFLKILREKKNKLCIALIFSRLKEEIIFRESHFLQQVGKLVLHIRKIPNSSYIWQDCRAPYSFYYVEIQKIRGRHLLLSEIRDFQHQLQEKLPTLIIPLSLPVFLPYNAEEAYRQLLLLKQEIKSQQDMPHVSLQFQKHDMDALEFLVHVVYTKTLQWEEIQNRFPASVSFFLHFQQKLQANPAIMSCVFSINIPSRSFQNQGYINLLEARRVIVQYLQTTIGAFRDFNGGLFEKRQERFENIKQLYLEESFPIPSFAQRLFYSLQPIESQICLDYHLVKKIFETFSELLNIKEKEACVKKSFLVAIKTTNLIYYQTLLKQAKMWLVDPAHISYVSLTIADIHYFCLINTAEKKITFLPTLPIVCKQTISHSTLRLHFPVEESPSFCPWFLGFEMRCRFLNKSLFEGLTRVDPKGKIVPAGAKSIQSFQNGLTYVFQLRSNFWSNGERVTAIHYVQSWKHILTSSRDALVEPFFVIKNAERVRKRECAISDLGVHIQNNNTITINLRYPDPFFLSKLAQPIFFPLLDCNQEPIHFNGPYYVSQKNVQVLLLEKNPFFWDNKNVFFDYIRINWKLSLEKTYELFKKGEVDWIGEPFGKISPSQINQLRKVYRLKKQKSVRPFFIHLNTHHWLLSSSLIRRALSLAIDRLLITRTIMMGDRPLFSPLFTSAQRNEVGCRANPSQARTLFAQGLKELEIEKKPPPSLALSYSRGRKALAVYLKNCWESLFNIHIRLEEKINWDLFRSDLEKKEFQIAGCYESALSSDPLELLSRWGQDGAQNFSQWINFSYQEAINKCFKCDSEQQTQYLKQAEKIFFKNMPSIPLTNCENWHVHNKRLKNYAVDQAGCVDFRWAFLEENTVLNK